MLPAKPKSGLSDTSTNKKMTATPKVSKLGKGECTKSNSGPSSPVPKPRLLNDRSPKSANSRTTGERQSPKSGTPDKQPQARKAAAELQAQLDALQEDVKKAREQLAGVEQEKIRALDELNDAKRSADEANEKLRDAIASQKKAEESLQLERLRADESEQAGIESCRKLETIQNQQSVDASVLLSVTQELERVKHELAMSTDAKNSATSIVERDTRKVESEPSRRKAELLQLQLKESNQSKESSLKSLAHVMQQLEESNALLQDAESEIATLKGKVGSLEIEVARYKGDFEESNRHFDLAQLEMQDLGQTVELLKHELQRMANDEKDATSNIQRLSKERDKLLDDLKAAKDETEEVKKAMAGLTSALHEVSMEARELQERLLTKSSDIEDAHAKIEQLESARRNTEEMYEVMLDEARYEIACLRKAVERLESEAKNPTDECDVGDLKVETTNVIECPKEVEHEEQTAKEDGVKMSIQLRLLEQSKAQENGGLSLQKTNGLPNHENKIKDGQLKSETLLSKLKDCRADDSEVEKEKEHVETETWGTRATTEKDIRSDGDQEADSVDDELEPKTDSFEQLDDLMIENIDNVGTLPKQQQKKKAFLGKFGRLLKKKTDHN
ncbi:uncharacterized protein [Typha latifolia]|uniref:uncharacterized protein n=1 Tax=Typha latifolia TaxID=4733 RepID=UPI003C2B20E6